MDRETFKQLIGQADIFRRGTLTETIEVLERKHADLAARVRSQLEQTPIQKPELHTGSSETDIFRIELFRAEVDLIVDAIGGAEIDALGPNYATTSEASHFVDLQSTWIRYRFLLDEKHAA
jgi:hypothetical protein